MGNDLVISNNRSLNIKYLGFLSKYSNEYTQKVVHYNIRNFIEFITGHGLTLNDVDQSIINIYIDHMRKRKMANSSINQNISCLSAFFKHLGKSFEYHRARVEPYSNMKLISMDGLNKVLEYLDQMKKIPGKKSRKYLRDSIVLRFLFLSANRKGTLLNLKYSDIAKESGQWMYTGYIKGGYTVKRLFPEQLLEDLWRLKELEGKSDSDYVITSSFNGGKNKMNNMSLNKILNSYYQKVNKTTEHITVHSIRALAAKKLFELSKDLYLVKQTLLHKQVQTSDIYISKMMEIETKPYLTLETCIKKEG